MFRATAFCFRFAAQAFREKVKAEAEGRSWSPPANLVRENLSGGGGGGGGKDPLPRQGSAKSGKAPARTMSSDSFQDWGDGWGDNGGGDNGQMKRTSSANTVRGGRERRQGRPSAGGRGHRTHSSGVF